MMSQRSNSRRRLGWTVASCVLFSTLVAVSTEAATPTVVALQDDDLEAKPGIYFPTVEYQKLHRPYRIEVASSVDVTTESPVLLFFHGGTGGMYDVQATGLATETRKRGWLLVSPQGTPCGIAPDGKFCWNAIHCCGLGNNDVLPVDDVGFVDHVLDDIDQTIPIDRSRVYAMGYSNGAMLVHRLASERSTTYAAVGAAAGTIGGKDDNIVQPPTAPVPFIMLHGELDPRVEFDGGIGIAGRYDSSFDTSQQFWADANGCDAEPKVKKRSYGSIRLYRHCTDKADVVGVTFANAGHPYPNFEKIDTAKWIVRFFSQHSR